MVDIIPKEVSKIPTFLNILFYSSIVALVFSLAAFFILNGSLRSSKEKLTELNSNLTATVGDAERISLEKEVFRYQDKINTFATVFKKHKASSNIFDLIQKYTHPNVWFKSFDLNLVTSSLGLTGQAKDFKSLGQQIIVLGQESAFQKVDLFNVSISDDGKVNFNLSISVDPTILNKI